MSHQRSSKDAGSGTELHAQGPLQRLRNRPSLLIALSIGVLAALALLFYAYTSSGPDGRRITWGGSALTDTASDSATGTATAPGMSAPEARGTAPADAPSAPATPGESASRPPSAAEQGARLAAVRNAPEQTLSALKLPDGFTAGAYSITFQPYGWGPDGEAGKRLVILIVSAKPDAGASGLPDLTGRNAIVYVDSQAAGVVKAGGSYNGTLSVRPDSEGRGEFHLVTAEPSE